MATFMLCIFTTVKKNVAKLVLPTLRVPWLFWLLHCYTHFKLACQFPPPKILEILIRIALISLSTIHIFILVSLLIYKHDKSISEFVFQFFSNMLYSVPCRTPAYLVRFISKYLIFFMVL